VSRGFGKRVGSRGTLECGVREASECERSPYIDKQPTQLPTRLQTPQKVRIENIHPSKVLHIKKEGLS
jgi:hypothetical protein